MTEVVSKSQRREEAIARKAHARTNPKLAGFGPNRMPVSSRPASSELLESALDNVSLNIIETARL